MGIRGILDKGTAYRLIEMTKDFYTRSALSFSETRQRPWQGWVELLEVLYPGGVPMDASEPFKVADIGCGNMRFEALLADRLRREDGSPLRMDALCVDATKELMECSCLDPERSDPLVDIECACMDIIGQVASPSGISLEAARGDRDLVVCFAMMHHIPLHEWRASLLDAMIDMAAHGGCIALSFWQFSKDERILSKAKRITEEACRIHGIDMDPDSGDHFLGWKDDETCLRYCHDLSDDEIDSLIHDRISERGDVVHVASFCADGRSGDLNRYVILKRI